MSRKNRRAKVQQRRRRVTPPEYIKAAKAVVVGTCPTGKLRYPDERNAWLALRSAQRKHLANGAEKVEQRYYPCITSPASPDPARHCNGWHLTHLGKIGD